MIIRDYLTQMCRDGAKSVELIDWLRTQGFDNFGVFCAQPFRLEMIPKYFKGWKWKGARCVNEYGSTVIFRRTVRNLEAQINNWVTVPIVNLNDFIRNCELCKINLKAKE